MSKSELKSESITIRMSPSFYREIQIRSQDAGLTRSEIVNSAIGEFLQKQHWVSLTVRKEILAKNIVQKAEILHESIKNSSKLNDIEVEINKIAQILTEKSLFTSENVVGSDFIGDVQALLLDIDELDHELYQKCVKILSKNGNKKIVSTRILIEES